MKVLHLNTSDLDGGAARGAYWLHNALQKAGVESQILTSSKSSNDASVMVYQPKGRIFKKFRRLRRDLDKKFISRHQNKTTSFFSPASWAPSDIHQQINSINPDIVNLHWVNYGFLTPEDLPQFNQPIIWTLRDMWGFTGGCHYTDGCTNYIHRCGSCPQLESQKENDISRKLWQRKSKAWGNLDLTIVTISHWLADCARDSNLFRNRNIEVIHNALDESKFKPRSKHAVREALDLPQDKKIILFGALKATADKRKGFQYLELALQKLAQNGFNEHAEIVVFGASEPENAPDFGMKTTYMGMLHDDITLASVYAAADVTLVPSVQEAFGKTAMESLACGTPVVSFDSTGLKDIVEHQQNGYRAKCFSPDDLAEGISWVLQNEERWQKLSHRAREKVEQEFTLNIQARAYLKLYQTVLSAGQAR